MNLIFDCDGVIVDSMLLHVNAEASAYSQLGIEITPAELASRFGGVPQSVVSQELSRDFNVPIPQSFESVLEENKRVIFQDNLVEIPGFSDTIEHLAGYKRCVASGSSSQSLREMLKIVGLLQHFEPSIFSSDQVERGKPAPDLFLFSAAQIESEPSQCVVIEDSAAGIQAANKAGMHPLGFAGGSHCTPQTEVDLVDAGAALVFNDIAELPKILDSLTQSGSLP